MAHKRQFNVTNTSLALSRSRNLINPLVGSTDAAVEALAGDNPAPVPPTPSTVAGDVDMDDVEMPRSEHDLRTDHQTSQMEPRLHAEHDMSSPSAPRVTSASPERP
jgi:hypothetical protein